MSSNSSRTSPTAVLQPIQASCTSCDLITQPCELASRKEASGASDAPSKQAHTLRRRLTCAEKSTEALRRGPRRLNVCWEETHALRREIVKHTRAHTRTHSKQTHTRKKEASEAHTRNRSKRNTHTDTKPKRAERAKDTLEKKKRARHTIETEASETHTDRQTRNRSERSELKTHSKKEESGASAIHTRNRSK